MVDVTTNGDYKIVTGTETEILQEMNSDGVAIKDVVGFEHSSSTDAAVMYQE